MPEQLIFVFLNELTAYVIQFHSKFPHCTNEPLCMHTYIEFWELYNYIVYLYVYMIWYDFLFYLLCVYCVLIHMYVRRYAVLVLCLYVRMYVSCVSCCPGSYTVVLSQ